MSERTNDETKRLLGDIRTYLRITAAATSKQIAMRVLDSFEKALVYSKMDGNTSSYKIQEATSVPNRTVLDWADEFVRSGLASSPDGFYSSHRALFSLNELSIDISTLKKRRKSQQSTESTTAPTLEQVANQGEKAS
jgi:hypothetical protein